jgi:outer membrane protein W
MKKIILTGCLAVTALFASNVNAQTYAEVEKATDATPFSIEALVTTGALGLDWNLPALRARYFVSDKIAVRLQLAIGNGSGSAMSESTTFYENANGTGGEGIQSFTRNALSLQIGGEYHFLGTQKLDPYAALGINITTGKSTQTWEQFDGAGYNADYSGEFSGGYSGFGAQLGLGMDYYFVENIYVGVELGVGVQTLNDAEVETQVDVVVGSTTVSTETLSGATSRTYLSNFASIRLGWRF